MHIIIDNSKDEENSFFYRLNTDWVQYLFMPDVNKGLLWHLENLLQKLGRDKVDIEGIGVIVGKGRFTTTRVAVTTANTLALALKIPVIGLSDVDGETFANKIKNTPVGQYVSAKYSGEAHIGNSKIK